MLRFTLAPSLSRATLSIDGNRSFQTLRSQLFVAYKITQSVQEGLTYLHSEMPHLAKEYQGTKE